jgi:hypothetical protein
VSSLDIKHGILKAINDHFKQHGSYYSDHEGPFRCLAGTNLVYGQINHLDEMMFFQHLETLDWQIRGQFYMVVEQENNYQGTYMFGKFNRLMVNA